MTVKEAEVNIDEDEGDFPHGLVVLHTTVFTLHNLQSLGPMTSIPPPPTQERAAREKAACKITL